MKPIETDSEDTYRGRAMAARHIDAGLYDLDGAREYLRVTDGAWLTPEGEAYRLHLRAWVRRGGVGR